MIREPRVDELELITDIAVEHATDAGLIDHDTLERNHFKKQIRAMMISPDYKIWIYEKNGKFAAYIIAGVFQKLWNSSKYGEIILFFVHPEVRNKFLADDLFNTAQNWFLECGCLYQQASCLMYDDEYNPNTKWLHRATTYFKTRGMEEVGYHYVQNLEMFR